MHERQAHGQFVYLTINGSGNMAAGDLAGDTIDVAIAGSGDVVKTGD